MTALPHAAAPTISLSAEAQASVRRRTGALWLALQLLEPAPDAAALDALAAWAVTLTPVVVPRPGEGLLLELGGSLRYFSGLAAIRQQIEAELARRGLRCRLAVAPTPLAASWLARCRSVEIADASLLAGAVGALPLTATGWPDKVQLLLGQMGLRSIADCLRLPRAGFARRVGRAWLEDLDRALGRLPDPRASWREPRTLSRSVEFTLETGDRRLFAEVLRDMAASCEQELRRCQAEVPWIELRFRHLHGEDTRTRMHFVEPVHERGRILGPLRARIEALALARPAIALALTTGPLLPLKAGRPTLLPPRADEPAAAGSATVPEFALVECLRGRYGAERVHGIGQVAGHRPEHAWHRWIEKPGAGIEAEQGDPAPERPLWLLPRQRIWCQRIWCQTLNCTERNLVSDTKFAADLSFGAEAERIESGWWDGREVRRDYHVVVGAAGEKLWLYRDCLSQEWYLHGIFG